MPLAFDALNLQQRYSVLVASALLSCVRQEADLAQLVERLIRNQQVAGSSPAVGSISSNLLVIFED